MAKKEPLNKIPKKFRSLKRSFVESATTKNSQSFISFPKDLDFHGRDESENIILIARTHWIVYLPQVISALLVLLFPWILASIIPTLFAHVLLLLSLIVTCLLAGISIMVATYIKWYYNVSIITDQRVIDLDFPNIMSHSMSEAQLEKIEDITHKQLGILGSFFDVGTVYIQTAGTAQNIEFQNIPRPRDVQDILVDLLEAREKGEI